MTELARDVSSTPPQPDPAFRTNRRRAVATSAAGWALDGFDFTMFALALSAILASLHISVGLGGTISTISLMASAIGGVLGGVLADRLGRVRVLCWVVVAFSVFTALTATAQDLPQLILWRALEGIAFGAEWPVGVALLAEYAESERRGRLMAFMQSAYAIGWVCSTLCYFVVFSTLPQQVAANHVRGRHPARAVRAGDPPEGQGPLPAGDRQSVWRSFGTLWQGSQRARTLKATLLLVGGHGINYSLVSFLPLYLRTVRGLPVTGTAIYTWIQISGAFFGYVSSGFFHDRFGRRTTFTVAYVGIAATMVLFLFLPAQSTVVGYLLIFLLGFTLYAAAGGRCLPVRVVSARRPRRGGRLRLQRRTGGRRTRADGDRLAGR
jgi:MFS family permease